MTAPRSSLVSQFLPPSFFCLCLHVGEHDDLAIAVLACVVRGLAFLLLFFFALRCVYSIFNEDKVVANEQSLYVILIRFFTLRPRSKVFKYRFNLSRNSTYRNRISLREGGLR
ncbi:hypothetical protein K439DRAFT_211019 [Ramaria rubella]|nr:hypothetical protein K439DRAFT_211019 [Ramaria rubella]